MKRPDGVSWYLTATMNVYFPEGGCLLPKLPDVYRQTRTRKRALFYDKSTDLCTKRRGVA